MPLIAPLLLVMLPLLYGAVWLGLLIQEKLPDQNLEFLKYTWQIGIEGHIPVHFLFVQCCRFIWGYFSYDESAAIIFETILVNTATLALLLWASYRYGKSWAAIVVPFVLFGASSWVGHTYLFYSYAPWATTLTTAALMILILAFMSSELRRAWFAVAGGLLALLFWSSSSAIIQVMALFITVFTALFWHYPRRLAWQGALWFGLSFLLPFLLILGWAWPYYHHHVTEAMTSNHVTDAMAKFHWLPDIGWGGLIKVWWVQAPFQVVLFCLALGIFIFLITKTKKRGQPLAAPLRPLVGIFVYLLLCWIGSELTPTPTLARAYYQNYPVMLFFLSAILLYFIRVRVLIVGLLCIDLLWGGRLLFERMEGAMGLKKFYQQQCALENSCALAFVREDPHADALAKRYMRYQPFFVPLAELSAWSQWSKSQGRTPIVIFGPRGPRSGNSIDRHCTLSDFSLPSLNMNIASTTLIKNSSHLPNFLMEEEICQGVYFAGLTPSPSLDESHLMAISL